MNIPSPSFIGLPTFRIQKIKQKIFSLLPFITAAYAAFPTSNFITGSRFLHAPLCYFPESTRTALTPNLIQSSPIESNFCINKPENLGFTKAISTSNSPEPPTSADNFSFKKMDSKPKTTYRSEYKPVNFDVDSLYLTFDLDTECTTVEMEMKYHKRTDSASDMFLNGDQVALKELRLNDKTLQEGQDYSLAPGSLTIFANSMPSGTEQATVYSKVEINPKENLKLLGLYASGKMLCTQNEAEGFRRITYFFDRPDVMTKYKVKMTANKTKFPILLCNGNRIDYSEDGENHTAVYEDPFHKPCYLFALVAGQLEKITSSFKTMSGREVRLQIFSEPENVSRLEWAMESLKESMKWDEETFGLEYDLDEFNIVATRDFNMGAMENKSLNIFNTVLILADPKMTTDRQYKYIKVVIGHEYFHNWTGNRVTCQDWFQLTLKEGLTVYREHLFSAATGNPSTARINEVKFLRSHQFAEDSGPMAHPIRPDAYQAVENFYTNTVYQKGGEVIRMYEEYLGKEGFRKGMDLYFQRHDGQAVTCNDFRAAMADANNFDLTQFEEWYSQSGTPRVTVIAENYDAQQQKYTITFRQKSAPQKDNKATGPLMIPIRFGLIGKNTNAHAIEPKVLNFNKTEQTFTFENVTEPVIPSMFRGFSAPVIVEHDYSMEDALKLSTYDDDPYIKWDSLQKLTKIEIEKILKQYQNDEEPTANPNFINAFKNIITKTKDKALISFMIAQPTFSEFIGSTQKVDLDNLIKAKEFLSKKLAFEAKEEIIEAYNNCMNIAEEKQNYHSHENEAVENRELANTLLTQYISCMEPKTAEEYSFNHFMNAKCPTDKISGLSALSFCPPYSDAFNKALEMFYEESKDEPLLLDIWFSIQASSDQPDTIERINKLIEHKNFNIKNPNRLRSLISAFSHNVKHFHNSNGMGYKVLEDAITKVDSFNPLMSSSMANSFTMFKKMDENRQTLMKNCLKNMISKGNLSKETTEVVYNCLNQ